MISRTTTPKLADIDRKWHVIDVSGKTLGRISSEIAQLLQGKHKINFSYHFDNGDYVVVVNAKEITVTGNKLDDKKYYHHSGFPGGIKEQTMKQIMQKDPRKLILQVVRGMLPKNRIGNKMITRLKVYSDAEHPHLNNLSQGSK